MRDIDKTQDDTIPQLTFSRMNYNAFQELYAKTNTLPDEFLNSLLNDNELFNQFLEILKDSSDFRFVIAFPNTNHISISKFTVIDALRAKNHPNQAKIDDIISPTAMTNDYANQEFSTNINNKNISIEIPDILKALLNQSHISSISLSNIQEIELLKEFLSQYPIDYKYDLPPDCLKRIETLQAMDLEAIGKLNETKDLRSSDIKLNPELIETVTKDIPNHFDTTEKAIYIYIKLCDLLSYNTSYITHYRQTHQTQSEISYIEQVTSTYNQIVCYNFTSIFGRFLSMMDLNYEILILKNINNYKTMLVESDLFYQEQQQTTTIPQKPKTLKDKILEFFSKDTPKPTSKQEDISPKKAPAFSHSHSALTFKSDSFIINADAVKKLYINDLTNVKLEEPLSGLTCTNTNKSTQLAFDKKVAKVYDYYKQQKKKEKNTNEESTLSFEDVLTTYTQLFFRDTQLSLNQKKEILLNSLSTCNLPPTEALGYLLHLYNNVIFCDNEAEKEQVGLTLYKDEQVNTPSSFAVAIIFHGEEEQEDSKIHLYRPPNKIENISSQKYDDMRSSAELIELGKYGFDINSKPKGGKVC